MVEKHSILVADDDDAIADAIQLILESEGYSVKTTADTKAVSSLSQALPDLLLLDIWLSGVDGRDICRLLKSKKETAGLPIILVSASRDVQQSAKEAGANDFIAKPFEMAELLQKVKQFV